jgi:murein DD-endopeptidase MepM/ murein hydrolase activator NlpD
MKKKLMYSASAVIMLLVIISCPGCKGITSSITSGFNHVANVVTNANARQQYAREFTQDKEQLNLWETAYTNAITDSLDVTLPYGEKGTFAPYRNVAYSYITELQEGEVLVANVAKDSINQRVFMDVFEDRNGIWQHAKSSTIAESSLEYEIAQTGRYKIVIQPEVLAASDFFISLNKRPLYTFPVAGKGNAAVGSFWGMDRDGGKRSHEGIDIFANRGTPVVAATNGSISFTGERGIGGKQVWLRDGLFGKSLYYAHLDSIKVQSGASVKKGDTLGFVGNTGNARTTPPHLHFGIYRSGAVNPLPYVFQTSKVIEAAFAHNYKATQLKAKGVANLRKAPNTKAVTLGTLKANDTIALLGQHNDWLHIQTRVGQKAFVHKSLVKEMK